MSGQESIAAEQACEPAVLVVDDDASVRRSLKFLLRSRGYAVRDYGSGNELLEDPDGRRGSCLVTDYVMPGIDGLSLLLRLRATGWPGPAILLTGLYKPGLPSRAAAAGFSLVLEKPLADRAMLNAIREVTATDR